MGELLLLKMTLLEWPFSEILQEPGKPLGFSVWIILLLNHMYTVCLLLCLMFSNRGLGTSRVLAQNVGILSVQVDLPC